MLACIIVIAAALGGRWALATPAACFVILAGVLGSESVAERLARGVEWTPGDAADLRLTDPNDEIFDAVVVLGGSETAAPGGLFELGRDGERIFTAAQFWHTGRTKTVITTGSSAERDHPRRVAADLLRSVGVPDKVLFDVEGFNTVGEMKNLAKFFTKTPPSFDTLNPSGSRKIGLITSAFHMNRAMRLARAASLEFVPLPVAFRQGDSDDNRAYRLIPRVGPLETSTFAIREHIAWLLGR